jgi:hypothetical protein
MSEIKSIDLLRVVAFVLTIVLAFYGLVKGFDTIELMINFIYFAIIIVVLLHDNIDIIRDM